MPDPFLPSCVVGSCYLYLFVDKNPTLSLFMPYHQVCNKSNQRVALMEEELPTLLKDPRFIVGFVSPIVEFSG